MNLNSVWMSGNLIALAAAGMGSNLEGTSCMCRADVGLSYSTDLLRPRGPNEHFFH